MVDLSNKMQEDQLREVLDAVVQSLGATQETFNKATIGVDRNKRKNLFTDLDARLTLKQKELVRSLGEMKTPELVSRQYSVVIPEDLKKWVAARFSLLCDQMSSLGQLLKRGATQLTAEKHDPEYFYMSNQDSSLIRSNSLHNIIDSSLSLFALQLNLEVLSRFNQDYFDLVRLHNKTLEIDDVDEKKLLGPEAVSSLLNFCWLERFLFSNYLLQSQDKLETVLATKDWNLDQVIFQPNLRYSIYEYARVGVERYQLTQCLDSDSQVVDAKTGLEYVEECHTLYNLVRALGSYGVDDRFFGGTHTTVPHVPFTGYRTYWTDRDDVGGSEENWQIRNSRLDQRSGATREEAINNYLLLMARQKLRVFGDLAKMKDDVLHIVKPLFAAIEPLVEVFKNMKFDSGFSLQGISVPSQDEIKSVSERSVNDTFVKIGLAVILKVIREDDNANAVYENGLLGKKHYIQILAWLFLHADDIDKNSIGDILTSLGADNMEHVTVEWLNRNPELWKTQNDVMKREAWCVVNVVNYILKQIQQMATGSTELQTSLLQIKELVTDLQQAIEYEVFDKNKFTMNSIYKISMIGADMKVIPETPIIETSLMKQRRMVTEVVENPANQELFSEWETRFLCPMGQLWGFFDASHSLPQYDLTAHISLFDSAPLSALLHPSLVNTYKISQIAESLKQTTNRASMSLHYMLFIGVFQKLQTNLDLVWSGLQQLWPLVIAAWTIDSSSIDQITSMLVMVGRIVETSQLISRILFVYETKFSTDEQYVLFTRHLMGRYIGVVLGFSSEVDHYRETFIQLYIACSQQLLRSAKFGSATAASIANFVFQFESELPTDTYDLPQKVSFKDTVGQFNISSFYWNVGQTLTDATPLTMNALDREILRNMIDGEEKPYCLWFRRHSSGEQYNVLYLAIMWSLVKDKVDLPFQQFFRLYLDPYRHFVEHDLANSNFGTDLLSGVEITADDLSRLIDQLPKSTAPPKPEVSAEPAAASIVEPATELTVLSTVAEDVEKTKAEIESGRQELVNLVAQLNTVLVFLKNSGSSDVSKTLMTMLDNVHNVLETAAAGNINSAVTLPVEDVFNSRDFGLTFMQNMTAVLSRFGRSVPPDLTPENFDAVVQRIISSSSAQLLQVGVDSCINHNPEVDDLHVSPRDLPEDKFLLLLIVTAVVMRTFTAKKFEDLSGWPYLQVDVVEFVTNNALCLAAKLLDTLSTVPAVQSWTALKLQYVQHNVINRKLLRQLTQQMHNFVVDWKEVLKSPEGGSVEENVHAALEVVRSQQFVSSDMMYNLLSIQRDFVKTQLALKMTSQTSQEDVTQLKQRKQLDIVLRGMSNVAKVAQQIVDSEKKPSDEQLAKLSKEVLESISEDEQKVLVAEFENEFRVKWSIDPVNRYWLLSKLYEISRALHLVHLAIIDSGTGGLSKKNPDWETKIIRPLRVVLGYSLLRSVCQDALEQYNKSLSESKPEFIYKIVDLRASRMWNLVLLLNQERTNTDKIKRYKEQLVQFRNLAEESITKAAEAGNIPQVQRKSTSNMQRIMMIDVLDKLQVHRIDVSNVDVQRLRDMTSPENFEINPDFTRAFIDMTHTIIDSTGKLFTDYAMVFGQTVDSVTRTFEHNTRKLTILKAKLDVDQPLQTSQQIIELTKINHSLEEQLLSYEKHVNLLIEQNHQLNKKLELEQTKREQKIELEKSKFEVELTTHELLTKQLSCGPKILDVNEESAVLRQVMEPPAKIFMTTIMNELFIATHLRLHQYDIEQFIGFSLVPIKHLHNDHSFFAPLDLQSYNSQQLKSDHWTMLQLLRLRTPKLGLTNYGRVLQTMLSDALQPTPLLFLPQVRGLRQEESVSEPMGPVRDSLLKLVTLHFTRISNTLVSLYPTTSEANLKNVVQQGVISTLQSYVSGCSQRCTAIVKAVEDTKLEMFVKRFVLLMAHRPCFVDQKSDNEYRIDPNVNLLQACIAWTTVLEVCWAWTPHEQHIDQRVLLKQYYISYTMWNIPLDDIVLNPLFHRWIWRSFYNDQLLKELTVDNVGSYDNFFRWMMGWHSAHQLYMRHLSTSVANDSYLFPEFFEGNDLSPFGVRNWTMFGWDYIFVGFADINFGPT